MRRLEAYKPLKIWRPSLDVSMYPLAKSYFGVTHVAVLEHVVHSVALSLPLLHKGPLALAVTLEPEAFSGGWRVRSEFGILGYLDAAETAEFPALQRVRASGFRVATDATVELVSEDATIDVAVNLGLAPWMVPVALNYPADLRLAASG